MIWDAQHIHHQLMMSDDHVVPVSSHHTQQVPPSCACIDVLHHRALYLLSAHIGRKACVYSQTNQWLVSWDVHHILISSDDA